MTEYYCLNFCKYLVSLERQTINIQNNCSITKCFSFISRSWKWPVVWVITGVPYEHIANENHWNQAKFFCV